MNEQQPLAWDDLADCLGRLDDARRHGTPEAVAAAEADFARARDRLGLVAAAIFAAAVGAFGHNGGTFLGTPSYGYVLPATWLRLGEYLDVPLCFDMAKRAKATAAAALRSAAVAAAEADALRKRLGELERRIDDLTPGVGDPETETETALGGW